MLLLYLLIVHTESFQHNFNQRYRIPESYDKKTFPSDVVDVDVGFYYGVLNFLDPPTSSFGVKHIVHLKWTDRRLRVNLEIFKQFLRTTRHTIFIQSFHDYDSITIKTTFN